MAKETTEIWLAGQRIQFRSDADPEIVRETVALAQMKIKDAESRAKGQPLHLITLTALLDMAEEYVKARQRAAEHRQKVNDKTSQLLELIDPDKKPEQGPERKA